MKAQRAWWLQHSDTCTPLKRHYCPLSLNKTRPLSCAPSPAVFAVFAVAVGEPVPDRTVTPVIRSIRSALAANEKMYMRNAICGHCLSDYNQLGQRLKHILVFCTFRRAAAHRLLGTSCRFGSAVCTCIASTPNCPDETCIPAVQTPFIHYRMATIRTRACSSKAS